MCPMHLHYWWESYDSNRSDSRAVTLTAAADWSPAASRISHPPPSFLPSIQLSDMCFIATAVLLTILQSLSHNHILMNNVFISSTTPRSLSFLFVFPSCPSSRIFIPSFSLSLFAFCSNTDCRSVSAPLPLPDPVWRELVQQSPESTVIGQLTQLHAGPGRAQRHPVHQHPALPQHPAPSHESEPRGQSA